MNIFNIFFKKKQIEESIEPIAINTLVREKRIIEKTSDITCIILNPPDGFYTCNNCLESFRYKGHQPYPCELNCPDCNSIMHNDGLYKAGNGENRDRSYIRKNINSEIDKLENLYNNSKSYHPLLCEYAQYFYSIKDYNKAIEIGWNIHNRWLSKEDQVGTAPLDIVGKAHRALAKAFIKQGNIEEAIKQFEELIKINRGTENDNKILTKLQSSHGGK